MFVIEVIILCILFFVLCFLGTGSDEKNLKNYSSYPDVVQDRIKSIDEYRGKFKEENKLTSFIANFVIFTILFLILGIFIREKSFVSNFTHILIMGQVLNIFDLVVIDLWWWRGTSHIRFTKIPQRELYQNPKKHIDSFVRALVMYVLVAVAVGYILTLF